MSTNKVIDKIAIGLIILALVASLGLMYLKISDPDFGSKSNLGYETRLFDNEKVHTIDIVMNNWDEFIENCESEEYYVCTIAIDGEKYSNIAIRAKGNTSLSNVKSMNSERYSFKLEFDHYEDGKTYYGLDKLCLNNIIQDNTMMKDYLVYQMMDEFGVDAPLCSYTYITVNGEDWGLYLAVEGIEDSFLERNYDEADGDLYKPDSMSFGGGRGNGKDFNMDEFDFESLETDSDGTEDGESFGMPQMSNGQSQDMPQMTDGQMPQMPNGQSQEMPQMPNGEMPQMPDGETPDMSEFTEKIKDFFGGDGGGFGGGGGMGSSDVKLQYIDDDYDSYSNIFDNAKTEVTSEDKKRLIASLKQLSEYSNLEEIVDIDEVIRYFVVHNFVCNGDSYTGSMVHNYYLYEEDGQMSMIPWDYNLAYGTFQGGDATSTVNADIDSPVSNGSVDDRPMVGWIFSDDEYTEMYHERFSEFISEWIDSGKLENMIRDTAELISPYVEKDPTKFCTTEEFETAVDAISSFVSLRGEAVSRQLAGDDTAVECGDLNLSDMGTMGGGMGGGNSFGPGRGNDTESQPEVGTDPNAQGEDGEQTLPEGFDPGQMGGQSDGSDGFDPRQGGRGGQGGGFNPGQGGQGGPGGF